MEIINYMKVKYISIILIILCLFFLIGKKFFFLKISISNEYFIQQKPFSNNYILKSKQYGNIIEYIYEWNEVDDYIFGSGSYNKDFYFLYDKKNNTLTTFQDLHSFYQELDPLNLEYKMDNCDRIIDFKKLN